MTTMYHKWRDEPNMIGTNVYIRKFAYLPVKCVSGEILWFSNYYRQLRRWTVEKASNFEGQYFCHTDTIGNITEQEYLIRKLAGSL